MVSRNRHIPLSKHLLFVSFVQSDSHQLFGRQWMPIPDRTTRSSLPRRSNGTFWSISYSEHTRRSEQGGNAGQPTWAPGIRRMADWGVGAICFPTEANPKVTISWKGAKGGFLHPVASDVSRKRFRKTGNPGSGTNHWESRCRRTDPIPKPDLCYTYWFWIRGIWDGMHQPQFYDLSWGKFKVSF